MEWNAERQNRNAERRVQKAVHRPSLGRRHSGAGGLTYAGRADSQLRIESNLGPIHSLSTHTPTHPPDNPSSSTPHPSQEPISSASIRSKTGVRYRKDQGTSRSRWKGGHSLSCSSQARTETSSHHTRRPLSVYSNACWLSIRSLIQTSLSRSPIQTSLLGWTLQTSIQHLPGRS